MKDLSTANFRVQFIWVTAIAIERSLAVCAARDDRIFRRAVVESLPVL